MKKHEKKMLIYCHPYKYKDKDKTHFLIDTIKDLQSKYKIKKTLTLDLLPGGDITADGFSDKWIENNKNKWTVVFVPDCGGPWVTAQDEHFWFINFPEDKYISKDKVLEKRINMYLILINKLKILVEPGGVLLMSKWVSKDLYNEVLKRDKTLIKYPIMFVGNDLIGVIYYKGNYISSHSIIKSLQNNEEIGGFFIKQKDYRIKFVKTADSKESLEYERKSLNLPTGMYNLLWHTHPKKQGFWPSFEDLLSNISYKKNFSCYINLIFTIYGTWVIAGIDNIKNDTEFNNIVNIIYKNYDKFNIYMTSLTQLKVWSMKDALNNINTFSSFLEKIDYGIIFMPFKKVLK